MLCQLCSLFACVLILFGFGLPLVCVIMMLVVVRARLAVAAHALCRTPTKLNPKRPSSVLFFFCFPSLLFVLVTVYTGVAQGAPCLVASFSASGPLFF